MLGMVIPMHGRATFSIVRTGYAAYAVALPFRSYNTDGLWVNGTNYVAASSIPGYSYTRSGAKAEVGTASGINRYSLPGIADWSSAGSTYNNLRKSSGFSQTLYWDNSALTITDNAYQAPDGTMTASKLIETTATASHSVGNGTSTYIYTTFSAFVKPNGRRYVILGADNSNSNVYAATFDLQTGVVSATSLQNYSTMVAGKAYIYPYPNGWYRCVITYTRTTPGSDYAQIHLSDVAVPTIDGNGNYSYTGDGVSGAYVWQAQMLQGTFADGGPIVPVDIYATSVGVVESELQNVPAIIPGVGYDSRVGLTNSIQYSADWSQAAWSKDGTTATANIASTPAPDGSLTVSKVVENAVAGVLHQTYQAMTFTATGYTLSVFARAGERSFIWMGLQDAGLNRTWFNLATGAVGTNAAGNTASITPVGSGWYRCTISRTMTAASGYVVIGLADADNSASYTGIAGNGVYLWQAGYYNAVLGDGGPIATSTNSLPAIGADALTVTNPITTDQDFFVWTVGSYAGATNSTSEVLIDFGGNGALWIGRTGGGQLAVSDAISPPANLDIIQGKGRVAIGLRRRAGKSTAVFKRTDGTTAVNAEATVAWAAPGTTTIIGNYHGSGFAANAAVEGFYIKQGTFSDTDCTTMMHNTTPPPLSLNFSGSNLSVAGTQYATALTLPGANYTRSGAKQELGLEAGINRYNLPLMPDYRVRGSVTNLQTYSQQFEQAAGWNTSQATISANVAVAPDGTVTGDALIESNVATVEHNLVGSYVATVSSASPVTFSVYAKQGSGTRVLQLWGDYSNPSNVYANFDLTAGVIGNMSGAGVTATMTPAGGGWYRCAISYVVAGTSAQSVIQMVPSTTSAVHLAYTGDGTSSIYLWQAQLIPATINDGGPIVPTKAIARSIGLIETFDANEPAVIPALGSWTSGTVTNNVLYSQRIDGNTPYSFGQANIPATTYTAPDGTSTALSFNENASGTNSPYIYQTITDSATTTYSLFMKANGRRYAYMRVTPGGADYAFVVFDLQAGTITSTQRASATYSGITGYIVNAGNGWYRGVIVVTRTGSGSTLTLLNLSDVAVPTTNANGDYAYACPVGPNGVLVWQWQALVGNFPDGGPIIPTASATVSRTAPKTGYWSRTALTNQETYSQAFGSRTLQNITVSSGAVAAPDGTMTASTLTANASVANAYAYTTTAVASGYNTTSVFVSKTAGTAGFAFIQFNSVGANYCVSINKSTGALADTQGGFTAAPFKYAVDCGAYWRLVVVTNATSAGTGALSFCGPCDAGNDRAVTNGASICVWQQQTLAGNLPDGGPLITTTTATASTGADALTAATFDPSLGDWLMYGEYVNEGPTQNNMILCVYKDASNFINIRTANDVTIYAAGVQTAYAYCASVSQAGSDVRWAVRYRAGKATFFSIENGTLQTSTEVTASAPIFTGATQVMHGHQSSANQPVAIIKQNVIKQGTFSDADVTAILNGTY